MKVTIKQKGLRSEVQFGLFGWIIDLNDWEASVQTISTLLVATRAIPEASTEDYEAFMKQSIHYVKSIIECIRVKTTVKEPESIIELDIDPKTLVTNVKAIKLPEQDPNASAEIDVLEIIRLVQYFQKFVDELQNPPKEEEQAEAKSLKLLSSMSYSINTICDMLEIIDREDIGIMDIKALMDIQLSGDEWLNDKQLALLLLRLKEQFNVDHKID